MNSQQTRDAGAVFSPVLVVYLLMVLLMAGAVSFSISHFLGWAVALPVGIALTYCFSRLVKVVVAPRGEETLAWRVGGGLAALMVFGATLGLSYSTLYAKVFAQTSALEFFAKNRLPFQRQLEAFAGNAATASKALAAWSAHSDSMAKQEATTGGTCPSKAASASGRGPIAMFRAGEKGIAANLHVEVQAAVAALESGLAAAKQARPVDFSGVARLTADLNGVGEQAEGLARGALVKSTRATLQDRLDTGINWPNGETFACGDTARDELLNRALSALAALEQLPVVKPMVPGIDLSNPQAVANRGLLRSFNSLARLMSFGHAGQFTDDPLMEEALAKGLINQETIGMFTAALLELCVVLASALASRRGAVPFGFDPGNALASWKAAIEAEPRAGVRLLHHVGMALCKALCNLLWAYPAAPVDATQGRPGRRGDVVIEADPVYPVREVDWAASLAPFLVSWHDGDYLCMPAGRSPRTSMMARALQYQGAAVLLNTQVPWVRIASNRVAASQLRKLVPNAEAACWEVFRLEPGFAQAMRLALLKGSPK